MKVSVNNQISDAIRNYLIQQDLNIKDFAIKLGYHTELAKKMTSGNENFNFTLNNICRVEVALNIKLITIKDKEKTLFSF